MISRRSVLMSTLFGTGYVGLRALATGLPASFLLNPRKALAGPVPPSNPLAQFVIFQTSGEGDPINANVPGTYDDTNGSQGTSGIAHSAAASMAATELQVGSWSGRAALPWAEPWAAVPTGPDGSALIRPPLWQSVLDRTTFWHIATETPVHPKEQDVLKLMAQTRSNEMLASLLSKNLQAPLGTIQAQPLALGATSPSEALVYEGQPQQSIPPLALKATLANPVTSAGKPTPLTALQSLRDQTMSELYDLYKNGATPAQRAYIDSFILSQQEARAVSQNLVDMFDSITDNTVQSQITAAIALIKMKVTPVLTVHIPFGGDNHSDTALFVETQQTTGTPNSGIGFDTATGLTGVPGIAWLMNQLNAHGLMNQVTFMSLNVFGRTLAKASGAEQGRQHNANHHVALTIGTGFKAGVVGGVVPSAPSGASCVVSANGSSCDYGATGIDSQTGAGSPAGDVTPATSLPSWGQTVMAGLGIDSATIAQSITTGKIIKGGLSG